LAKIQKESLLQRKVRMSINVELGPAYTLKTHGDQYTAPGIPDILCCIEGTFVGIECKMWRGRPSAAQALHMRDIIAAGGIGVYSVWDKNEGVYYWVPASYPFTYRTRGHWIPARIIQREVKGRAFEVIDCSYLKAALIINNMEKNNANKTNEDI
jgi:hypothetical protein